MMGGAIGAIGSIGKATQNFTMKGSLFTIVGKISPSLCWYNIVGKVMMENLMEKQSFYIHFPIFYNNCNLTSFPVISHIIIFAGSMG